MAFVKREAVDEGILLVPFASRQRTQQDKGSREEERHSVDRILHSLTVAHVANLPVRGRGWGDWTGRGVRAAPLLKVKVKSQSKKPYTYSPDSCTRRF